MSLPTEAIITGISSAAIVLAPGPFHCSGERSGVPDNHKGCPGWKMKLVSQGSITLPNCRHLWANFTCPGVLLPIESAQFSVAQRVSRVFLSGRTPKALRLARPVVATFRRGVV